jgi:SRSO17 transposase
MVNITSKWEDELAHWLEPFLDRLGHKARRRMCPLYVAGLIGPGDRKSVQPMAERFAPHTRVPFQQRRVPRAMRGK